MTEVQSCNLTDEEIKKVAEVIPAEEVVRELSDFLKVFGDPTRMRILFLLR